MTETLFINLFGGPGCGKTVLMAALFVELKKAGQTCEMVPEYVKDLVWDNRTEELDNQHHIARMQYRTFLTRDGKTRFVVTDGPLGNALFYNRHYPHVCDIDKTEKQVLRWLGEFRHLNLFLSRGDFRYETQGRLQSEAEARSMDAPIYSALSVHLQLQRLEPFPCPKALAREVLRAVEAAGPAGDVTRAFDAKRVPREAQH